VHLGTRHNKINLTQQPRQHFLHGTLSRHLGFQFSKQFVHYCGLSQDRSVNIAKNVTYADEVGGVLGVVDEADGEGEDGFEGFFVAVA
jgi:hypothetical protein